MFGFIANICGSCSSREAAGEYQSNFCGLGCQLSQDYSPLARFLVNRDSTYLSIIGHGLSTETATATMRTCCNPFAAQKSIVQDSEILAYSAAVTVCGLATKLEDDVDDEHGIRKYGSKLFGLGMTKATDKAVATLNNFGFPTQEVKELLLQQSVIEKGKPDLYAAADPTMQAYGIIFSHLSSITGASADSLRHLGQHLGQLIYWRDAFDDLAQDQKSGKFNLLNYTPVAELANASKSAMESLLLDQQALPLRHHQELASQILQATNQKHRDLQGESREEKQRKRDRFCDRCSDSCDCCSGCVDCRGCVPRKPTKGGGCGEGSCFDQMFDCGPGDTGCCDCNCCDCSC